MNKRVSLCSSDTTPSSPSLPKDRRGKRPVDTSVRGLLSLYLLSLLDGSVLLPLTTPLSGELSTMTTTDHLWHSLTRSTEARTLLAVLPFPSFFYTLDVWRLRPRSDSKFCDGGESGIRRRSCLTSTPNPWETHCRFCVVFSWETRDDLYLLLLFVKSQV